MIHRLMVSAITVLLLAAVTFAAEIGGIWVGQEQGRQGQLQDVALRFKVQGTTITGTLFGDEFDIPISEAVVMGDQIRFTVTTTNFYSGSKIVFRYTGTVKDTEMELVRERVPSPDDKAPNRGPGKQTLKLKRID